MLLKRNLLLVCVMLFFPLNNAFASRCYGSDNCSACRTCSSCKHCSREGGTCGVCSENGQNHGNDRNSGNDKSNKNGLGKLALFGGGTYFLYRVFRKKNN